MSLFPYSRLSDVVQVSQVSHASTNIERDRQSSQYVVGADALAAIRCVADGMNGAKRGTAVSIIGPYGSGKSTLGLFMNRLVGPETEFFDAINAVKAKSEDVANSLLEGRRRLGVDGNGMIRCRVMARREPIHVTIFRAIENGVSEYFGRYSSKTFDGAPLLRRNLKLISRGLMPEQSDVMPILRGLCSKAPVMLLVDEFGKNVEYFTDDDGSGDLFLLQELTEASGKRGLPLYAMTFQHMAFDDYAVGASSKRRREWAKIQGRFEEIVFSNTLAQTQLMVAKTLRNDDSRVHEWAINEARVLRESFGMDYDENITAKCYPLHPVTLAVLPELCSRYGQNERTLLSFMQGGGGHTVSKFIEDTPYRGGALPTVGTDMLYDYFISGAGTVHGSSSSITRLREIETIIRDVRDLGEMETKVLKTVGILNLIGHSGPLRASRNLVRHVVGDGAGAALRHLAAKGIVTYRDRIDEYRVWHGTDIDVSARLGLCRQRYDEADAARLLSGAITMEPVIASRHGIRTGTMRIFQQVFDLEEFDSSQDGVILYGNAGTEPYRNGKPVITASIDSGRIASHILDIRAMRDLLSESDIAKDWVARNEVNERLLAAESELRLEMSKKGGVKFSWNGMDLPRSPGHAASTVCDAVYISAPRMSNEIINRNKISGQAASARNILVEAMTSRPSAKCLGIEGWGAERAIYEAILVEYGMHGNRGIHAPRKGTNMRAVWDAVMGKIKKARGKVNLEDLYEICRLPPFGMKEGVIPLLVIPMILCHAGRMTVYEHGTFVNGMRPDVAERLVKNPVHFELKHVPANRKSKTALAITATEFGLDSNSTTLDVVKVLVERFAGLNDYARNTKKMNHSAKAVRDVISKAREPDVLLAESLPEALGFPRMRNMSDSHARAFSKRLAEGTKGMSGWFDGMMDSARTRVLEQTGMADVKEAAEKAAALDEFVADKDMKPFLVALAADLGDDSSWIEYVAMTLTGAPPASWKDWHRDLFENKLHEMAGRFRRLAALRFGQDDDAFLVTVTKPDGTEEHTVITDKPGMESRLKELIDTFEDIRMKLNSKEAADRP